MRLRVDDEAYRSSEFRLEASGPRSLLAVAEALGQIASTEVGAITPDAERDQELEDRLLPGITETLQAANRVLCDKREADLMSFKSWQLTNGNTIANDHVKQYGQRVSAARASLIDCLRELKGGGIQVAYKTAIKTVVKATMGG